MSLYNKQLIERVFGCIDHTTLTSTDNDNTVEAFCRNAAQLAPKEGGHVAAVCVFPRFVAIAKKTLKGSGIKVASVAGSFPHGQLPIEIKKEEVKYVVAQGADEVDIVLNRGLILQNSIEEALQEVQTLKEACQDRVLKVILETCDLPSPTLLMLATQIAVEGGADFVKTSTGKGAKGATIEAAEIMLQVLRDYRDKTGRTVGFKAAGGIRLPEEAISYAQLAARLMGDLYIQPASFRIGASSLTERLIAF